MRSRANGRWLIRGEDLAFKLATGRIRPIGRLGTQERVAVGADRKKPWLEKFPDFLVS